jgi:hypothetical protein
MMRFQRNARAIVAIRHGLYWRRALLSRGVETCVPDPREQHGLRDPNAYATDRIAGFGRWKIVSVRNAARDALTGIRRLRGAGAALNGSVKNPRTLMVAAPAVASAAHHIGQAGGHKVFGRIKRVNALRRTSEPRQRDF